MYDDRRYSWVVLRPSPKASVEYLRSPAATAAAAHLHCGEYLALLLDADTSCTWDKVRVAYLVQPASLSPLPSTYLPISPCRVGPRPPLSPGFAWPFEHCVVNTGTWFEFEAADESQAGDLEEGPRHYLPAATAREFLLTCLADGEVEALNEAEAERAAARAGGGGDDASRWTTFSPSSTQAPVADGELYRPARISASIVHNLVGIRQLESPSRCVEDAKDIRRLRARFARAATERTMAWEAEQVAAASAQALPIAASPLPSSLPEFPSSIVEFSTTFHRPHSPDRGDPDSPPNSDNLTHVWGLPLEGPPFQSRTALPDPPAFDADAVEVLYLDAHGTLIDNESGIFAALQPLLARCSRTFDRQEALGFYFESETEEKRRTPTAPYLDILAAAYDDMCVRLGLRRAEIDRARFVSSMFTWPLFDGALECMQRLRARVPTLVLLADMDEATLVRTAAFQALEPWFDETWSWDASQTYRPDPRAFRAAFAHHDAEGIDAARRCLVSNSVFRDLEPARLQRIPAMWLRLPSTLAEGLPSVEHSVPGTVCGDFESFAAMFLPDDL